MTFVWAMVAMLGLVLVSVGFWGGVWALGQATQDALQCLFGLLISLIAGGVGVLLLQVASKGLGFR